jgi:2-oxoisovalerate dehydrogenase E1 component
MPEAAARLSLDQTYATAILIREVEQRLLELFAAGKLFGTVHTCIGQELVGVAVAQALAEGDLIFSNHRCHGHFLARTGNVEGLIAEIMGKSTGVCGGRGGSQHLCERTKGFFSSGIQGGILPIAAGLAMSLELRATQDIAVVFIGDGTLGEGVVYETLNIISKWELPLLVVLENNGYAQSTSQGQTLAGDIASRASAFNLPFRQTSTWEPETLQDHVIECAGYVRQRRRPFLLQADTYRLMAHSKGDDDRDPAEVNSFWKKDPIQLFLDDNPESASRSQHAAKARVDQAVACALDAPFAKASSKELDPLPPKKLQWKQAPTLAGDRVVVSIREALRRNMQRDSRIILLGEDIESPYGGAFKITKGLSDEFPSRVRNTPISEASIIGLGNGLALAGFLPVCEIMFGDFLTLAADQLINHSSKFRYMYNDQVTVPLIVRTPMGGRRGYGPTHSQSLEKHFLGLPDTKVLATHQRYDPGELYDKVFATVDRPHIVIENKLSYASRLDAPVKAGFTLEHSDEQFPTTRLRPAENPEVTVFCYGGMLPYVEEAMAAAFEEFEIVTELICPSQLYPLNLSAVIESLGHSHRLLIVEEGSSFAALGAELIAQLHELAPGLAHYSKRLGPPEQPIPSCAILENELLPNVKSIVAAIVELAKHV